MLQCRAETDSIFEGGKKRAPENSDPDFEHAFGRPVCDPRAEERRVGLSDEGKRRPGIGRGGQTHPRRRKIYSQSLAEKLASHLDVDASKPLHQALSDREYQVMRMIAFGQTVKEIACDLSLSVKTVAPTARAF